MQIRVYYEDTDCGNIVYHSKYLNFCERARSEIFFQKGLSPHNEKSFFVVTKMECDFKSSAKLGDLLTVQTDTIQIKKASIVLEQKVFKKNSLLFQAKVTLAYLHDRKPNKIPKDLLTLFQ